MLLWLLWQCGPIYVNAPIRQYWRLQAGTFYFRRKCRHSYLIPRDIWPQLSHTSWHLASRRHSWHRVQNSYIKKSLKVGIITIIGICNYNNLRYGDWRQLGAIFLLKRWIFFKQNIWIKNIHNSSCFANGTNPSIGGHALLFPCCVIRVFQIDPVRFELSLTSAARLSHF